MLLGTRSVYGGEVVMTQIFEVIPFSFLSLKYGEIEFL